MTILAVVYIGLWLLASLVFENWKATVKYPKRPLAVGVLIFAWELVGIALAVTVLFS
jgi:hypothetical protein